jgi:hypothetical protein
MIDQNLLQAAVDGMSAQWQKERAASQMTLGAMIDTLAALPKDAQVANLSSAHSYRGYYCDLAFEHGEGTRNAADLLADCRAAMGEVFTGYKGGDFLMGRTTPVWVANYGCGGVKLMAIGENGAMEVSADD